MLERSGGVTALLGMDGFVVLTQIGGVGKRNRAVVAHPGHRDGGVQSPGKSDADALADRKGTQDLGHGCPR